MAIPGMQSGHVSRGSPHRLSAARDDGVWVYLLRLYIDARQIKRNTEWGLPVLGFVLAEGGGV